MWENGGFRIRHNLPKVLQLRSYVMVQELELRTLWLQLLHWSRPRELSPPCPEATSPETHTIKPLLRSGCWADDKQEKNTGTSGKSNPRWSPLDMRALLNSRFSELLRGYAVLHADPVNEFPSAYTGERRWRNWLVTSSLNDKAVIVSLSQTAASLLRKEMISSTF